MRLSTGEQVSAVIHGVNCGNRVNLGTRTAPAERAVFTRDGAECQECLATENLSLDHIIPWSLNGPDTVENLRVLCRSCNSRKGARIL